MFDSVIQNRVDLSVRVPALLSMGPQDWEKTLYNLGECLEHFWTLSQTTSLDISPLDTLGNDELVALIMGFAISHHIDIHDRGVLEAGPEYFAQSKKVEYLLGRFARQQLRAFSISSGTRESIYPLHSVTLGEVFARAKRAENLLYGFQGLAHNWSDGDDAEIENADHAFAAAKSLSDDELVDCILISWQIRQLSADISTSNFFVRESFTQAQLDLGIWLDALSEEFSHR